MDETRWNVSRLGVENSAMGLLDAWPTGTLDACGQTTSVAPDDDLVVCGGQLTEGIDGGFDLLAMRVRQPFDFSGTGSSTVAFDVDADFGDGSAWLDVWLTDRPLPFVRDTLNGSSGLSPAGNALGFFFYNCPAIPGKVELATLYASSQGTVTALQGPFLPDTQSPCFDVSSGSTNHFEMRVGPSAIELWASDAGMPNTFRLVAHIGVGDGGPNSLTSLPLTKSYVTFEHIQRGGTHAFHWDNIGFDGPLHPTPRAVDVPDSLTSAGNGQISLGYLVPDPNTPPPNDVLTLALGPVDLSGARSVHLDFGLWAFDSSRTLRTCVDPPTGPCQSSTSPGPAGEGVDEQPIEIDVDPATLVPAGNQLGLKITAQGTGFDSVADNLTLTVEVE